MGNDQSSSYLSLPDNLPVPEDDGAADHLVGMKMPPVNLQATNGKVINLGKLSGVNILFCYPMTGVPGVPLPPGWDDIPGARGCTPQACSYRDAYPELIKHEIKVFGISTQGCAYQMELHDRLELPYDILSDENLELQRSLNLPTFEVEGRRLLKRLTLIVKEGVVDKVHYPVFPSNKDVDWVLEQLSK